MSVPGYQKSVQIKSTSSTVFTELPATGASLNLGADMLDDTDITSTGFRSRLPGLLDWSVTAPTNFEPGNQAFVDVRAAFLNRTRVVVRYLPDGTNGFEGVGYIETFSHSGDVGGLETVDVTIQADIQLTTI